MLLRLLLVAAFCLGSLPGVAQALDPGGVRGTVLDLQGQPVPGARIRVWTENGAPLGEVTTDADGRFHLEALRPGAYQLKAEVQGAAIVENNGRLIIANQDDKIDLRLPINPPKPWFSPLEVVTCTSPALDDPAKAGRIWIRGTVMQRWSRQGFAGAQVTLRSKASTSIRQVETGEDGSFSFSDLPPGVYEVSVEPTELARTEGRGAPHGSDKTPWVDAMMNLKATGCSLALKEKPEPESKAPAEPVVITQEFLDRIPTGRGLYPGRADQQAPIELVPSKDIEIPVFPFDPEHSELVEWESTRTFPFQCTQPGPHRYHRH